MESDSLEKNDKPGETVPETPEFTPKRAKILGIFFRIFTILEFGFLGFIIFDLFRKYVITGNLDWWKK